MRRQFSVYFLRFYLHVHAVTSKNKEKRQLTLEESDRTHTTMLSHTFFLLALACAGIHYAHGASQETVDCDIVVAGGSTASLAAAITATEADPSLIVCFTEITDWPGGQMTAGKASVEVKRAVGERVCVCERWRVRRVIGGRERGERLCA